MESDCGCLDCLLEKFLPEKYGKSQKNDKSFDTSTHRLEGANNFKTLNDAQIEYKRRREENI